MRTPEDIQQELEAFTGDKRSKEYKELKKQLESPQKAQEEFSTDGKLQEPYPKAVYDRINSYTGRIPRDEVQLFFDDYNKIFGTNIERCNCSGKVQRMMAKLKGTYRQYLRKKENGKN